MSALRRALGSENLAAQGSSALSPTFTTASTGLVSLPLAEAEEAQRLVRVGGLQGRVVLLPAAR